MDFNFRWLFVCILCVMMIITMIACSGSDSGDTLPAELEGVWAAGPEEISNSAEEQIVSFNGSSMSIVHKIAIGFATLGENLDLKIEYFATFSIGGALNSPPGAKKIDITISRILVTPLSDNYVEYSNRNGAWGHDDWKIGESKEVTGMSHDDDGEDDPMRSAGEVIYDIFAVLGDTLYFGDLESGDGKTEATRPTVLEMGGYTKR